MCNPNEDSAMEGSQRGPSRDRDDPDRDEDVADREAGMLAETRQSGLTLTTFVQLFESVAGPAST